MDSSIMNLDLVRLAAALAGGFAGAQGLGALWKQVSLGSLGNTVTGLLGGLFGSQFAATVAPVLVRGGDAALGIDWNAVLAQIGGAGAGGALLTGLAGLVRIVLERLIRPAHR